VNESENRREEKRRQRKIAEMEESRTHKECRREKKKINTKIGVHHREEQERV
jgi:hypothetical protein